MDHFGIHDYPFICCILAYNEDQLFCYELISPCNSLSNQYVRQKIIDTLLMLIFFIGWHICHTLIQLTRPLLHGLCFNPTKQHFKYPEYETKNCWCSFDAHFQDGAGSVSLLYLFVKVANISFKNVCNQSTVRLPIMQHQKLLILHWHSFSRWAMQRVTIVFALKGSHCIIYECYQPIASVVNGRS